MSKQKICRFAIDGDVIEVNFFYDNDTNRWYGDFPVFGQSPRYTPNGRPWKNVFDTDCEHCDSEFGDCGGCSHFTREGENDVIAVCFCEEMRQKE